MQPKLYHILHVDKLQHVIRDGFLFSDAVMRSMGAAGTNIGLTQIKDRRRSNKLTSHAGLTVGGCVPFYFCPRSIMLYVLHRGNMDGLQYIGGQEPIVHLELDLRSTVNWANTQGHRWAFTLGNAGAAYYEDRKILESLNEINWEAVRATQWTDPDIKEGKQSEFLVEQSVAWNLVEQIGVIDAARAREVQRLLGGEDHKPRVVISRDWYY